ncbi:hypothetical protein [Salinivibrio sp. ES.052]|uniref:hypothetical protein n=1 Tax=Salinivibrio sp. ES.052 TaxID=1882823 RepID=UPI00092CBEAB|nr:hypothetical protein [Salinivibrio sp. ES.052]SIN79581.1 hypothetical protein SAMN05444724_0505 [Salinivibrio sp. ES.052]
MIDVIQQKWQGSSLKEELSSPLVQWVSLLCVLVIIGLAIIDPYLQWRAGVDQRLDQKQLQLGKLQTLKANESAIQQWIQKMDAAFAQAQQGLIDERTNGRAISNQVNAFEDVYRPLGLKFTGRRFAEPVMTPWLGENVQSNWRLQGSSDDILYLLTRLANQPKIMEPVFVEIKQVNASRRSKEKTYEIAINLRGYRKMVLSQLKARSQ